MRRESSEVSQLTYGFYPLTFDDSKPLIKLTVVFEALLNSIYNVLGMLIFTIDAQVIFKYTA